MGLLYCALAVACFTGFYLLVGLSQKRGSDPMGRNLATFAVGALLSAAAAMPVAASQFPGKLIVIG